MVALWYRASQYLGPMWEAQFGTVEDDTIFAWQEALRHLSEEQIAEGVNALSKWTDKYPPTIGKFRELCLVGPAPSGPALTHQPDREKARLAGARELQRMRAILGKANALAKENPQTKEEAMEALGLDKR